MQAIFTSFDKNDKNDKLSVDDSDYSDDNKLFVDDGNYSHNNKLPIDDDDIFNYGDDVKIGNDTETPHITSKNNLNILDFSNMSQRNQVIYIEEVACIAGFTSFANVFIAQLCNFPILKIDRLYVVTSIIYKSELQKTENLLRKDKRYTFILYCKICA